MFSYICLAQDGSAIAKKEGHSSYLSKGILFYLTSCLSFCSYEGVFCGLYHMSNYFLNNLFDMPLYMDL